MELQASHGASSSALVGALDAPDAWLLRILDSDGLDGLSMRRVAEELDNGAASLYWHVGSKDGLLDLIFDRVIGEQGLPEPEGGHWKEQIKQVARAQSAAIRRHRDLVAVSLGRVPMGPNALRYSEGVLAILRAGGARTGSLSPGTCCSSPP